MESPNEKDVLSFLPMKRNPDPTPALPGFEPLVHYPVVRVPQPDGSLLLRPGKPVVLSGEDEITTAEAARILGCTVSWMGKLCDRGTLNEGTDWRRIGHRGNYRIKRASVIRLKYPDFQPELANP